MYKVKLPGPECDRSKMTLLKGAFIPTARDETQVCDGFRSMLLTHNLERGSSRTDERATLREGDSARWDMLEPRWRPVQVECSSSCPINIQALHSTFMTI
ncbi:hypothetical protein PV327_006032 [Microctonus hyperodae]|uniref:Uncharacterized protein n=1 Tax=Microctonus hyperodae TaxID=165561 RepID=A0AA39G2X6_MICHY|nr:hypothetical protein PV327_006032 [Microctonus hyperodae]